MANLHAKSSASARPAGLVTIPQACALAQVTRRTIYNWIAAGKLTVWRSAGGAVRLERGELVRKEEREVTR